MASDVIIAEAAAGNNLDLPQNARAVATHVAGSVWKVDAKVGDAVQAGQTLVIVESMKMEIALIAPCSGTLSHLFCKEGGTVTAGQDLLIIVEK